MVRAWGHLSLTLLNNHFLLNTAMPFHRLEPASKHRALLDLTPVVKRQSIFNRAINFFLSARDHLLLVRADRLSHNSVAVVDAL